jgi:hypothetical protein
MRFIVGFVAGLTSFVIAAAFWLYDLWKRS